MNMSVLYVTTVYLISVDRISEYMTALNIITIYLAAVTSLYRR